MVTAFVFTAGAWAQVYHYQQYAVLDGNTLTFYNDNMSDYHTGTVYSLNSGSSSPGWSSNANVSSITKVVFNSSFDSARPSSCHAWFSRMNNLTTIQNIEYLHTDEVTDMAYMFNFCRNLTSLNLSGFNTQNVTTMARMFYECNKLESLNVSGSGFNTQNVTSMSEMFFNCNKLTSLNLFGFDTQNVTNMSSMFYYCTDLTSLYVDESFNTANVVNMSDMFRKCSKLTSLDVSGFNTAKVTNMSDMFNGCGKLTSLDVSNFNTAKVTNMSSMFSSCSELESLDVSGFNTANVTKMNYMFSGCSSLTSLDVSRFNTAKVTDMSGMFMICPGLTSLNLSNFTFSTTSSGMLFSCRGLKRLAISATANNLPDGACEDVGTEEAPCELIYPDGFTTGATPDANGVYQWKSGYFKESAPEPHVVLSTDHKTLTFCYDNNPFSGIFYELNTGSNTPGWYNYRTSVESVVFDTSFADARPTSCYKWFSGMSNLASITGIEHLNTDEVTTMCQMFNGCSSLTSLDVSGFNTANVTKMNYMFSGCSSLTSLNVSRFNTAKVTDMSNMFRGCSNLTSLNVSNFYILSGTNMSEMFRGCTSLTSLDLSSFRFYSSTSKLLYGCSSLKTLAIPTSANSLASDACQGVGTSSAPCALYYTEGFTLQGATQGNGYITWKSGTFKNQREKYVVRTGSTLRFFFDDQRSSQQGTTFAINSESEDPGWYEYRTYIQNVVFDPSFAFARPTSCRSWFSGMSNLTSITGIENLKTDEVTTMYQMFNACSRLTRLDVSGFNTAKVTRMNFMFYGCSGLTSINVSGFNTAKVNYFQNMFSNCSSLVTLNLSAFKLNSSSVSMLSGCSGLRTLALPATANSLNSNACTGVGTETTPCNLVYPDDITLQGVTPGDGYFTWKSGIFKEVGKDVYAELSTDDKTLTFYYDKKKNVREGTVYALKTGASNPGWYSKRSSIESVVFDPSFVLSRPTSCYRWFFGMTNLTSITGIGNLKTDEVTNMYGMFNGCSSLESLNVNGFNTAKVTNMFTMFNGCSNLKSLNLSSFNTANVTNMSGMFNGCSNLESLNVSGFNTAKVTNMSFMFYSCSNLTSLDVSGFNTAKVTDMTSMFEGCSSLTSLDVSGFRFPTSSANTSSMMSNCSGLRTLVIGSAANRLISNACQGVGTAENPCTLFYPEEGFTLQNATQYDGYFTWKSGYFKERCSAYAIVSPDRTTLTFYYDSNKKYRSGSGTAYELNTGDNYPGWRGGYQTITNVVFDTSFADARPESCMGWFDGMPNLATITGIEHLNTEEVTNMYFMFAWCESLTSVDLSRFDTSKVTDMSGMFKGCSQLTTIFSNDNWQRDGLTSTEMFTGCSSLEGAVAYNAATTDASMANPTNGYFTATSGLPGDVNNDNTVDIDDAEALANYLVGQAPASFVYGAADANNDGKVSIADVTTIIDAVINPNIPVTGITLNTPRTILIPGNTEQLRATVTPSNATNQTVIWESDTPSIATVDENGLVRAVWSGSYNVYCYITARAADGSGVEAKCEVEVVGMGPVPLPE